AGNALAGFCKVRENERFGMIIFSGKIGRVTLLGSLFLGSTLGCRQGYYSSQEGLAQRILPPLNSDTHEEVSPSSKPAQEAADGKAPMPALEAAQKVDSAPAELPAPHQASDVCHPGQNLPLPDAIALAFRFQPRLRASLETIQQAQGREDIVFAAFLPLLTSSYVAGGYHIQAGGVGFPIPG